MQQQRVAGWVTTVCHPGGRADPCRHARPGAWHPRGGRAGAEVHLRGWLWAWGAAGGAVSEREEEGNLHQPGEEKKVVTYNLTNTVTYTGKMTSDVCLK